MEVVFTDYDTGILVDNDEVAANVEMEEMAAVKDSDSSGSSGSVRNEFSPLSRERPQLDKARTTCSDMRDQRGLTVIITSSIVISAAITIALITHIYVGEPQVPLTGGAATSSPRCATVATDIMKKGGSTVDAAIAGILCDGVMSPMSSGIGGGGFMLIFDPRQKSRKAVAIDFREVAPAASTKDMFKNRLQDVILGNLGVAVPGMLKGLEKAHSMYGKIAWKDLVKPAADIARRGVPFDGPLADETECHVTYEELSQNPNTRKIFTKDGRLLERGSLIKFTDLAATLDTVAEKGAKAFYEGELADSIVSEMSKGKVKGILTKEDLQKYEVVVRDVLNETFQGYSVLAMPPPSSGVTVIQILKVMDGYNNNSSHPDNLMYHRLIEAFKFGYAQRTKLGDPDFNPLVMNYTAKMMSDEEVERIRSLINDTRTYPNDIRHYGAHMKVQESKGTAHLSFIGPDEVMVSATVSLNYWFGSKMMTSSGILLNNHMADFYYDTSGLEYQANQIEPGKRPLSSMSPVILFNTPHGCKFHMTLGGTNGTRIITGIVQAIIQNMTFGHPLDEAIELPRLHTQLYPDIVEFEGNFSRSIVKDLKALGHTMQQSGNQRPRCQRIEGLNVVNAVGKTNQTLTAHSDLRRGGQSDVF